MTDGDLTGQTVLVTGGAGFVGSHLAASLTDAAEVCVLDDLSNSDADDVPAHARLIEGDVRNRATVREAMDGVDVVFHEAAMVSVPASVEAPMDCHGVNGTATLQLLDVARQNDSRVVLASSAAIYGHPESVPVTETDPKRPTSPYGVEKLSNDEYARVYAEQYGLETVALRYFNIYGPRQTGQYSGVISVFLDQARAGDPITVEGEGDQTRDFVHVDDVVRANRLAATRGEPGEAYNVGTGASVTIRELAETVRDVTGADVPIEHVDPRPNDIQRSRADVSKAQRELGFEPTVSLRDGLARTVE
jgi:UDP-glucose 4-epimerase